MVELLIDGKPVVLSSAFKATITEENAFLSDQGEYATNVVISLLIPSNAKLYKYLNRPNSEGIKKGSRTATLKVDNKIVVNGTELIIDNSDTEVEIQIVSGLSEVKYLVSEDLQLRSLDLGRSEGIRIANENDFQEAIQEHIKKEYPAVDWQPAPFERADSSEVGNSYRLRMDDENNVSYPYYEGTYKDIVPQPYFCYILTKVFRALGYRLEYNAIEETEHYGQAIIVHGVQTMEYAKMLPEWSVKEFLDEIALLFGCVFVIDSASKSVRIEFQYNIESRNRDNSKSVVDLEVLDEYKRNLDEDNRIKVQNSNVEYKMGGDQYYKYANMPSKLREREILNLDMTFADAIQNIPAKDTPERHEWETKLLRVKHFDYFFALSDSTLVKIDWFAPLINNPESEDIDVTMGIVPAAMEWAIKELKILNSTWRYYIQYPIAGIDDYPDDDLVSIIDVIEGESEGSSLGYDTMRLAIYGGMLPVGAVSASAPIDEPYPTSYVESYAEWGFQRYDWLLYPYLNDNRFNPFRLKSLNEEIYSKIITIDTTEEFVYQFVKPRNFNIRSVFNIRNREYLCSKIETEISDNGAATFSTGYFHPRVREEG